MFRTTKFLQKGYHRGETEEFLKIARSACEDTGGPANFGAAQVRAQGFYIVRGGYSLAQIDATMNHPESASVAHARANHAAVNGQKTWMDLVSEQVTTLYPRLLRPAGERFSHPKGRRRGYRSTSVDALLERLMAYFDEDKPLTSREVRDAVFAESKGIRAYAEGPVNTYLTCAVEVLLAMG